MAGSVANSNLGHISRSIVLNPGSSDLLDSLLRGSESQSLCRTGAYPEESEQNSEF